MTSIHFVVHPLPGTEDQLNDRYFVAARGKVEFKFIFVCGVRDRLYRAAFTDGSGIVMCVFSGLNSSNHPQVLQQGPASLPILVSLLLPNSPSSANIDASPLSGYRMKS